LETARGGGKRVLIANSLISRPASGHGSPMLTVRRQSVVSTVNFGRTSVMGGPGAFRSSSSSGGGTPGDSAAGGGAPRPGRVSICSQAPSNARSLGGRSVARTSVVGFRGLGAPGRRSAIGRALDAGAATADGALSAEQVGHSER
jgi:hypothetical protein